MNLNYSTISQKKSWIAIWITYFSIIWTNIIKIIAKNTNLYFLPAKPYPSPRTSWPSIIFSTYLKNYQVIITISYSVLWIVWSIISLITILTCSIPRICTSIIWITQIIQSTLTVWLLFPIFYTWQLSLSIIITCKEAFILKRLKIMMYLSWVKSLNWSLIKSRSMFITSIISCLICLHLKSWPTWTPLFSYLLNLYWCNLWLVSKAFSS